MAIATFLAMTAAEISASSQPPSKIAWMACRFSPYGRGLSNLPGILPEGSLLILDDSTPPQEHDPDLICRQLSDCVEKFRCRGILLDFQRKECQEAEVLVRHISEALPCPVGASPPYADYLNCAVFLPPVPPSMPLPEYLAPWKGREIWLELGLDGEAVTLTEAGCTTVPLPFPDTGPVGFSEEKLHCHYTIQANEKSAGFTLWRNLEDVRKLLEDAEALGVTTAIGLFQELHGFAAQ